MLLIELPRSEATLIAALIAFFGGVITTFGVFYLRRREKRAKLRVSILTELNLAKEAIDRAAEYELDEVQEGPLHTQVFDDVYDAQKSEIGLLSKRELRPVITYYGNLKVAQQQLEQEEFESFIEDTAPDLKRARDLAEERVERHSKRLRIVWVSIVRYQEWQDSG